MTEELAGRPCERYDFTFEYDYASWWPEGVEKPEGHLMQAEGSIWFAKSDGLIQQMERRHGPGSSRVSLEEYSYNVELPDGVFEVPTDLKGVSAPIPPLPPEMVVIGTRQVSTWRAKYPG